MNETQIKIQKMSKALSIVSQIARICLYVAFSMEIITLLWLALGSGSEPLLVFRGSAVYGPLSPEIFKDNSMLEVAVTVIGYITTQAFLLPILIFANGIFKDLSIEPLPFQMKHAKRLNKIAVMTILVSIIPGTVQSILYMIFAPDSAANVDGFGMIGVIVAVLFFFLAKIFEYGLSLQQQADETL